MSGLFGLIYSLAVVSGHQTVTSPLDSVPGSLRSAAASAGPGDTILFSIPGQDTIALEDAIVIKQDLHIDGRSNAATGKRLVFDLDSLKRTVPAIEISKGYARLVGMEIRGGVLAGLKVKLRMVGVEVRGASANTRGISSGADSLLLTDCVIRANRGGGIQQDSGVLIAENCRFIGNVNDKYASVIDLDYRGKAFIRNSVFTGNRTKESAGAICNRGDMEIARCEFTENSGLDGGAILNAGFLHIDDSEFRKNSAEGKTGTWGGLGRGGAISNGDSLIIENSLIDSNSCKGPAAGSGSYGGTGSGGGIFNTGRMRVIGCAISRNGARGNAGGSNGYGGAAMGGGIFNEGETFIDKSSIEANKAVGSGGGYGGKASGGGLYNSMEMRVENSTIDGNTAEGFEGNSYGGDARAGGIYNDGSLNLLNSTVHGNRSAGHHGNPFTGSSRAGGLYNNSYAGIAFTTIADNTVFVEGGGTNSSWGPQSQEIYNRDSIAIANSIVFGSLSDSVDNQGNVMGVYLQRGLPANSVGSLAGNQFELFGNAKANLRDNGGPTLTLAIDSESIARGAGILLGVCETNKKIKEYFSLTPAPVYFDGAAWRTLEKDSLVASAGVSPILTDQRGFARPSPPGRGAYEFGALASALPKATRMGGSLRYLGMQGNRVEIHLPARDAYQVSLFDAQGRALFNRGFVLEAGNQSLVLTGKPAGATCILRISGGKSRFSNVFLIR